MPYHLLAIDEYFLADAPIKESPFAY